MGIWAHNLKYHSISSGEAETASNFVSHTKKTEEKLDERKYKFFLVFIYTTNCLGMFEQSWLQLCQCGLD